MKPGPATSHFSTEGLADILSAMAFAIDDAIQAGAAYRVFYYFYDPGLHSFASAISVYAPGRLSFKNTHSFLTADTSPKAASAIMTPSAAPPGSSIISPSGPQQKLFP